jgi:hypothetical protein
LKTTTSIKKELALKIVLLLSVIEGLCSIWATLAIPADSKKAFLFGLSASRLGIILVSIIGISVLIILLAKSRKIAEWSSTRFTSEKANRVITGLGILSIFLLWITIFTTTKNFFPFEAIFIRLRPTLAWVELVFLQFIIFQKIAINSFPTTDRQFQPAKKTFALIFLILVGIWIFITTTKIGLVQKTAFWNVPGIPLSGFQLISILIFIIFVLIFFSNHEGETEKVLPKAVRILFPILIFGIAVIVWGSTPMLKHFFSLQPTQPNLQPYPYSDARAHDLGAISILKGDGIYFHGFTDKPMFMVFLALLHLIAGNDYVLLSWAQIFILAIIPVLLYFFGKKYHSPLFGLVIAAIVILQQRNAIVLSYNIASVNPKLLVSEEFMFLGIVLVTYLLFSWMTKPEPKTILLLGGILGALSLVRMNPVFIVPVIVLIICLYFRKKPRILIKQTLLFGIGFLLVFSPWLFVGVDSSGKSWFFIKIQDVIINRYPFSQQTLQTNDASLTPRNVVQKSDIQNISFLRKTGYDQNNPQVSGQADLLVNGTFDEAKKSIVYIMANHFLHNFSTSLMALPDSIKIDNLSDLTQRDYWQDENDWQGTFTPVQFILILVNLALLGIGLAECWKRFRWAGFAPLIIFLAYDFSLSVALNSGSRYIVPINWIIFFYYILGLIFVIKKVLNILNIKTKEETVYSGFQGLEFSSSKRSIIQVFVLLVIIASIVPVANLVIPLFVHPNQENTARIINSIVPGQQGNQLLYGDILYPYYENNGTTITFDFLTSQVAYPIQIESQFLLDQQYVFESDLPAVFEFYSFEDKLLLESIYLIDENAPYKIWQKVH